MEKTVIKTAKTVDEAIEAAIAELGVNKEDCKIEVLNESSNGFLGIGGKDAEVKVTVDIEEETEEDEVYYGDDESFEGDAVSEAEDAAVRFVAELLSGIGIHGNMDSYKEGDTIYISVSGADPPGNIAFLLTIDLTTQRAS